MRILEDFSFISVNSADAEKIIDAFIMKTINGKKAIVKTRGRGVSLYTVIDDVPRFYKGKSVHTTWASMQNAARAIVFFTESKESHSSI